MTFKAFVVRDLFPEGMAPGAIPDPFKGSVGSGQIPRRDLRTRRRTQRHEESSERAGTRKGLTQNIHV
jgi:hypothetical protein